VIVQVPQGFPRQSLGIPGGVYTADITVEMKRLMKESFDEYMKKMEPSAPEKESALHGVKSIIVYNFIGLM